eukprot:TRINITY_DN2779_c0_g1_i1.p2 TRINITY_DN2779_c0_g1~~TRINITY_DN2779_c0_g1_i1.p2  ORF type:complete len:156 (-),score=58.72 TRINITY_DN2779_c0_g1_i1:94-561(-)
MKLSATRVSGEEVARFIVAAIPSLSSGINAILVPKPVERPPFVKVLEAVVSTQSTGGKYGYSIANIVVTIEESGTANVLNGTLLGTAQRYRWDAVQQAASGFAAAFRAVDAAAASESCHVLYAVSKDAVLYLRDVAGKPTVTVTDQFLWDVPKLF